MKTPEQLQEYFNRNKRNGEQAMLNIALKDLLDANGKYIAMQKTSHSTYNVAITNITSKMIGEG